MKKLIALTLCTVMTLTMAACGTGNATKELGGDPAAWGPAANKDVEIPNPFEEYETLSEAAKAAGFEFSVPDTIPGYENRQFRAIGQQLIEVIYFNENELSKPGDDELDNVNWEEMNFTSNALFIRKAAGNDDISGDFSEYAENNTISVNDMEVTTKGNDGTVNVAIWTNNGYTFAITTNNPMSSGQISELIKGIQ